MVYSCHGYCYGTGRCSGTKSNHENKPWCVTETNQVKQTNPEQSIFLIHDAKAIVNDICRREKSNVAQSNLWVRFASGGSGGGGGGLVLRPIATSTSEFQTVVTTRHNATMSGLNNTDKHTNPLFRLPLRVCVLFTFMLPLAVPSRGPEQTMPQRTHPSRQVGLNDDKGFQISEREFLCQN